VPFLPRAKARAYVCLGLLAALAGLWGTPSRAEQKTAAQENDWNRPFEPFRVIGNIYYVGTIELGVYLISTPAGHVLIDGGLPDSTPVIEAAIAKAGFNVTDIRILLTTQAHFDHVGTLAALAARSGGQVMVMSGDAELVEHGGHGDYLFGDKSPFDPVKVARVLKDGEMVTLGDQVMQAHHTPGHTRGCTTWTTTVRDNRSTYTVAFGEHQRQPGDSRRLRAIVSRARRDAPGRVPRRARGLLRSRRQAPATTGRRHAQPVHRPEGLRRDGPAEREALSRARGRRATVGDCPLMNRGGLSHGSKHG
jgi:hypothetical protein